MVRVGGSSMGGSGMSVRKDLTFGRGRVAFRDLGESGLEIINPSQMTAKK